MGQVSRRKESQGGSPTACPAEPGTLPRVPVGAAKCYIQFHFSGSWAGAHSVRWSPTPPGESITLDERARIGFSANRFTEEVPDGSTRITSFDFDHDESLRNLSVGQARHPDTPFEMHDWFVKEPFGAVNWQDKVREKIHKVDQMIVLCGEHTHTATGVATELRIAREERNPYFLLWGYKGKPCTAPTSAAASDKIYAWTWDNLKLPINGNR